MAGSPTMVVGMRSRTSPLSTREDTDYAKGIALLDPNENPFTLASMDMGKEKPARTIDVHWFEDELVPEKGQINYAGGDLDASSASFIVDDGEIFAVGDLIMHEVTREVMLLHTISTNTLTVIRDFGQSVEGWTAKASTIADDDVMHIIGNTFEEGHSLPSIRSTQEVDMVNYIQEQRTPIGMSEVHEEAAHRGEDDWTLQERKAGISHSRQLERQHWWGKPYRGNKIYFSSHSSADKPPTAGGMNHYIEYYARANAKKDEDELTEAEFMDFFEYIFEFGSGTRWCYCSPRLRTALDKWGIAKLNTFTKETYYGMAVGHWLSSHGEVIFKTHKMFKNPQASQYHYAFFVDMEKCRIKTYAKKGATRLRKLKPYEATGETGSKEEYMTRSCLRIGLPDCHARLRFKTIAA